MKRLLTILLFFSCITAGAQRHYYITPNCVCPTDTTDPGGEDPPPSDPVDSAVLAFEQALADSACTPLSAVQRTALDTLAKDLKGRVSSYSPGVNFWNRDTAYYPMVGKCGLAFRLNFKNPANTDAAYRLTVMNTSNMNYTDSGLILDAGGVLNTHINASTELNGSDFHVSYYSGTNNATTSTVAIGAYNVSGALALQMTIGQLWAAGTLTPRVDIPANTTTGLYTGMKVGTTIKAHRRGTLIGTATNSGTLPNLDIALMGRNTDGTFGVNETRQCRFASFGASRTDAEEAIFANIINEYNRRLSRNVY